MQAFGDHLRTDKNIALMVGKRIDDILIRGFITGGIQIHAQHACFREEGLYLIFNPFGTDADGFEFASAVRTDGGNRHMITAIMTLQFAWTQVKRHRHIALDATGRLTALHTLYLRGVAASVLKEDNLFIIRQTLPNTIYQRVRKMVIHLLAFVLPLEVNQLDIRQFRTAEPFG